MGALPKNNYGKVLKIELRERVGQKSKRQDLVCVACIQLCLAGRARDQPKKSPSDPNGSHIRRIYELFLIQATATTAIEQITKAATNRADPVGCSSIVAIRSAKF